MRQVMAAEVDLVARLYRVPFPEAVEEVEERPWCGITTARSRYSNSTACCGCQRGVGVRQSGQVGVEPRRLRHTTMLRSICVVEVDATGTVIRIARNSNRIAYPSQSLKNAVEICLSTMQGHRETCNNQWILHSPDRFIWVGNSNFILRNPS